MANPMTRAHVVKEAYIEGAKKLGTKVCVETHERIEPPVAGSGAPISVGPHPSLAPGQAFSMRGTTIANPQPSDIEVEAIIGKRVYSPKADPKSKEEMLLNSAQQSQEIAELKATVQALIMGLAQAQNSKPVAEPVAKPVDEPEVSMSDLRAAAKERGIKVPVGTTKATLSAQLEAIA